MPYFDRILPALEQGLEWRSIVLPVGDEKKESQYSVLRLLLIQVMEEYAVHCAHDCADQLPDPDQKRDLALIRRADQRQGVNWRLGIMRESTLHRQKKLNDYLLLLIMTGAFWAQQIAPGNLRSGLDFLLPEYQDMLYRQENLMHWHKNGGGKVHNAAVEIMPGRPMIACNRHPYDDIVKPMKEKSLDALLPIVMMIALTASTKRKIIEDIDHTADAIEIALYQEMILILEQHQSFFHSLLPPLYALEKMLLVQYVECYLYHSFFDQEKISELAALYDEEMQHELAHMKKITSMIKREKGSMPFLPDFPQPLVLQPQKGYMRDVLMMIGTTFKRGRIVPVGEMKKGTDFYRYQKRMCADPEGKASHQIIQRNIERFGMDYRYEIAPHPIEMMRNREKDAVDIGR